MNVCTKGFRSALLRCGEIIIKLIAEKRESAISDRTLFALLRI